MPFVAHAPVTHSSTARNVPLEANGGGITVAF
jgi:hypothetical protein